MTTAALVIVACSKGDSKPDTPVSAAAAPPSVAPPVHTTSAAGTPGDKRVTTAKTDPDQPVSPLPAGTLPKRIESYVGDADKFWKFVKGKGWYGWERQRKCKAKAGDNECDNDAPKTKMHVQAIRDANEVKINSLPAKGVVIGRMMNVGKHSDFATGIAGGQIVPDQYYFIIEPKTSETAALKVVILRFEQVAGTPTPKELVIEPGEREYYPCAPGNAPPAAEGDFKNCMGTSAHKSSVPQSELERATTIDALAWFSCGEGCCSAQYPPFVPPGDVKGMRKPAKQ